MNYDLSAREILDVLVSFPTVSSDTNLPLVEFVEGYFTHHGIESFRIMSPCGNKAGLVAQVGPDVAGGVVLSAHTDVVPVTGQEWSTDPWTVHEKDHRVYGRGTCDMKGFVAQAMVAMVNAKDRPLKRPLQIAFSRDEEVGLLGAADVAEALLTNFKKADAVIVGEPTNMEVVTGHKSCDEITVSIRGYEVHSSRVHEGVPAIMYGAQLINWIVDQNEQAQNAAPTDIAALYDPPFTTMHVGQISGGTANNITSKECHFAIDLRCVGDEHTEDWIAKIQAEADRLQDQMQSVHPDTYFKIDPGVGPGVRPTPNNKAEELARRVTGDNAQRTVAYGTDGGHFQLAGFDVVICGPGDIAQAHQPDEFLELSEFSACAEFLQKVIAQLEIE